MKELTNGQDAQRNDVTVPANIRESSELRNVSGTLTGQYLEFVLKQAQTNGRFAQEAALVENMPVQNILSIVAELTPNAKMREEFELSAKGILRKALGVDIAKLGDGLKTWLQAQNISQATLEGAKSIEGVFLRALGSRVSEYAAQNVHNPNVELPLSIEANRAGHTDEQVMSALVNGGFYDVADQVTPVLLSALREATYYPAALRVNDRLGGKSLDEHMERLAREEVEQSKILRDQAAMLKESQERKSIEGSKE